MRTRIWSFVRMGAVLTTMCILTPTSASIAQAPLPRIPDTVSNEPLPVDAPIIQAARDPRSKDLNALIASGANIETRSSAEGWTPLMVAAVGRRKGFVEALLAHGANVNAVDEKGNTPLILAVDSVLVAYATPVPPDPDIVEELIEKKPDLDHKNKDGRTAFMIALEDHNLPIMTLLYRAHASRAGIVDAALIGSARSDDVRGAFDAVGRNANVNALDRHGETPLILAAVSGYADIVESLIAHKANVDIQDPSGNTALIAAAMNGRTDVVRLLLDAGANTALKRIDREDTALHLAAEQSHPEIVKMLLDKGADPNVHDKFGETPLMRAARGAFLDSETGSLRTIQGTLKGDQVFPSSDAGVVLKLKARLPEPDIVKYLLQKGADPKATDDLGNTAFAVAKASGQEALALMLRDVTIK